MISISSYSAFVNWRAFTLAIIEALAWPAAITTIVLAFRRRIQDLVTGELDKLNLRIGEHQLELGFREARASVELAQQTIAKAADVDRSELPHPRELLRSLRDFTATTRPKAAIDQAYTIFESTLYEAAKPYYPPETGWPGASEPSQWLFGSGVGQGLVWDLRALRSRLDREAEVTVGAALQFIDLVDEVLELIERTKATREPGQSDTSSSTP